MGETSVGGILFGLLLALLGVGAVVGGGIIVAETTFAEERQEESEHGPMGLAGESSSSERSTNLEPVLGLVLAVGGFAAAVTGFVITSRSFERGKDRSTGPGSP